VAPGEGLNLGAACTATGTGTSLAAAAAAGAALIARQYYVDGYYPTGEPTAEQKALGFSPSGALLKATLVHAAVPVSAARDPTNGVSGAGAVPSAVQGFGRIQLDRALYVKGQSPFNKMSVSFTQELDNGGSFSTCINVAGTRALRATLAWMDVEADVMAGHTLVNDLDLAIYEIATGRTWRGNNVGGFDHANTVESITIAAPAIGKYKIVVHGVKLQFKQSFGLIITGDYADENCVDSVMGPERLRRLVPVQHVPERLLVAPQRVRQRRLLVRHRERHRHRLRLLAGAVRRGLRAVRRVRLCGRRVPLRPRRSAAPAARSRLRTCRPRRCSRRGRPAKRSATRSASSSAS
jgi:hypothetical protein